MDNMALWITWPLWITYGKHGEHRFYRRLPTE